MQVVAALVMLKGVTRNQDERAEQDVDIDQCGPGHGGTIELIRPRRDGLPTHAPLELTIRTTLATT